MGIMPFHLRDDRKPISFPPTFAMYRNPESNALHVNQKKRFVLLNPAGYFQTWLWTFQDPWPHLFEILPKMRTLDRLSTLRPWLDVEGISFCMGRFFIRVHWKKENHLIKNMRLLVWNLTIFHLLFLSSRLHYIRALSPPNKALLRRMTDRKRNPSHERKDWGYFIVLDIGILFQSNQLPFFPWKLFANGCSFPTHYHYYPHCSSSKWRLRVLSCIARMERAWLGSLENGEGSKTEIQSANAVMRLVRSPHFDCI